MSCPVGAPGPAVLQAGTIDHPRRVIALWAAGLVALAAYGYLVSTTSPFTWVADVAVAAGFVVVGAVGVRTLENRRTGHDRRRGQEPGALVLWVVSLGLLVGWELVTYFAGLSGHRNAWPTISSLTDIAFRYPAAKGAAVAMWIALGLGLVSR
jgi:hypothetical protein